MKPSRFRFRAWDAGRREMIYDVQVKYGWDCWVTESQERLMQSTGLVDRNGVEIFEGDILRSTETPDLVLKVNHLESWTRMVQYDCQERIGGEPQFNDTDWLSNPEFYEVIGNLHQHPELVESKQ